MKLDLIDRPAGAVWRVRSTRHIQFASLECLGVQCGPTFGVKLDLKPNGVPRIFWNGRNSLVNSVHLLA